MTPTVTWRMVALCLGALLLGKFAIGAIRSREDAARDRDAAAALRRASVSVDSIARIADDARAESARWKWQRDSVLRTMPPVRPVRARQYTTLVDTTDTPSVVASMVRLTAERDTAIADRDDARRDATALRATVATLEAIASAHATADSLRFARIGALADTVATEMQTAIDVVRPPWYRRWARGAVRGAQIGGVAVIAFTLGRAT